MGGMPRAWEPAGRLRQLRLRMGYTQQELAEKSGVSVRTIRDLECGRVRRPHEESLVRLASALGEQAVPVRLDRHEVTVQLLGPVVVRRDGLAQGIGSGRLRSLLALLALGHPGAVTQDAIVDALWGDRPPRSARSLVHVYIGQLRRLLGPHPPQSIVDRSGGGYRLMVERERIDAARFDDLVAEARRARRDGDDNAAGVLFESALGLWRGPVAADAGPRMQSHPAAVALAGCRLAVALEWADLEIEAGRGGSLAAYLRALAHEQPLHEGVHARLMLALAGAGDQASALRVFADLRDRLGQELGVQPGEELQSAHLRVLRQQHGPPAPRDRSPAQLPLAAPAFAGREAELAALDGLLSGPGPAVANIAILSGTAGVGKTALALHWAHRVRDRFSDGQLFVNLQGFPPAGLPMAAATALRRFLDALGVPPQRIPADPEAQSSLYRSLLAGRRMLVVLDNANDAEQVRPLLPGLTESVTLITSRSRLTGLVAVEGAHPVAVEPLPAVHAREVLARRVPAQRLASEASAVESIVRCCAGLPLALVIVGARVATNPHCALASIAEELRDPGTALDVLAAADPVTDIRTVFGRSYQALDPEPRRLFRLLGLHPGPDITLVAAASLAALSVRQVRALMGTLAEAHLVREHSPGRYSAHDLVRVYAAELANAEEDRTEARQRVLDHYAHSACAAARRLFPQRDPIELLPPRPGVVPEQYATDSTAIAWFSAEHQVLLSTVELADRIGADAHIGQLAWALTDFFETRGYWQDWVATQRLALSAAERRGDLRSRAIAHRGLARADTQLGRYGMALDQLGRALDLYGELGDAAGQALVHNSLAILTGRQGRDREALLHAEDSLRLFEAAGHLDGQARAHNTVGWFRAQLGEYAHAIDHCEKALALHEQLGNRHGAATTLDSLGYAHQRQGELPRAIECFEEALRIVDEAQTDRLACATMLTHLGDAYESAGDLTAARTARRRALAVYQELDYDLTTLPAEVRSAGSG